MPRHPKFDHRKDKTSGAWVINVPASITATGKREQHFFKTRDLAKAHGAKLREKFFADGAKSNAITPTLADDATAAAAVLELWGVSLLEAARAYAATREREAASKPLAEATAAWLLSCDHLRQATLTGYKQTVGKLEAALGDKTLANITSEELQAVITGGTTPSVAAHRHRHARAFWRWSCGKGWCQPEALDKVELPKLKKDGEIETLTPEQAETLLRVAETHFPAAVASYALQLFAGIRVEELARLAADNVTPDGIELGAAITKKGRRRHITLSKTLAAWLAKHPFEPCPNWRRVDRACRYLAGWGVAPPPELVTVPEPQKGEKLPPRPDWPSNALRHSHATYAVASGTALETLLFEFGHTGNANVLRAHYVGRASKKQALEFFAIMPKGVAAPATIQPVESVA
jgi:integrase